MSYLAEQKLQRFIDYTASGVRTASGLSILSNPKAKNRLRPANMASLLGVKCQHPFPLVIKPNAYIPETRYLFVPCGQCAICLANKRKEWTSRCDDEFKDSDYCIGYDLTYSNSNLPLIKIDDYSNARSLFPKFVLNSYSVTHSHIRPYSSAELARDKGLPQYNRYYPYLRRKDLTDFNKRVRKALGGIVRMTNFEVGEYGTKYARPHFHAMLFFHRKNNVDEIRSERLSWLYSKLAHSKKESTIKKYQAEINMLMKFTDITRDLIYLLLPKKFRSRIPLSSIPDYKDPRFCEWLSKVLSKCWTLGHVNIKPNINANYARYLGKYFSKMDTSLLCENQLPTRFYFGEFRCVSRSFGYSAFKKYEVQLIKQILKDPYNFQSYRILQSGGKYLCFPRAYWQMWKRRQCKIYMGENYSPDLIKNPDYIPDQVLTILKSKYKAFADYQNDWENLVSKKYGFDNIPFSRLALTSDGRFVFPTLSMDCLKNDEIGYRYVDIPEVLYKQLGHIENDCKAIHQFALSALQDHIKNR